MRGVARESCPRSAWTGNLGKGDTVADLFRVYRAWAMANIRRDEGQALVEYALILFLVALVSIGVLTTLGTRVRDVLNQVANGL
jgi:pilus assembly protein Flp/PilA